MRSLLLTAIVLTVSFAGCLGSTDSNLDQHGEVHDDFSHLAIKPERMFEPVIEFSADVTEQYVDQPVTFTIEITDLNDYEFPVDFIDWTVTIYDQEKPIQEGDGAQLPYSFEWTPIRDTTFWVFFNYDDSQGMEGFLGPIRIRTIDQFQPFTGLDLEGRVEIPFEYSPEDTPLFAEPQHCPDVSGWNPPDDRIPAMNGISCWVQPLPDLASGHGITITSSTGTVNGWLTRDCGTSTDAADLQEFIGEFSPYKTTVPFEGCVVLFEISELTGADLHLKMKPDSNDPLEHLATLPSSHDGTDAPIHPDDDDLDGINNFEDDCRDAAGPAEFDGCPDTDGDGLIDKEDACPESAGPEDNDGCPLGEVGGEVAVPTVEQKFSGTWYVDNPYCAGGVSRGTGAMLGTIGVTMVWVDVDAATWGQTYYAKFSETNLINSMVSWVEGTTVIRDDLDTSADWYNIRETVPEGATRAYFYACGTIDAGHSVDYITPDPDA